MATPGSLFPTHPAAAPSVSEAPSPAVVPPTPPVVEAPPRQRRMLLVDGSNQAFRLFFAIQQDMRAPDGSPTRALYGFANLLIRLLKDEQPDYLLVAFDRGLSFRNDIFPDYKGQRPDMPEELRAQWDDFIPLCTEWGVKAVAINGMEADDVIGTLAARYGGPELRVHILSSDKDFCQLVNDHVFVHDLGKDELLGRAEVEERWGVRPEQIIDLLSLMGDTSDNVPGIAGVGPKKAAKFIQTYGTAEGVIENAAKIGGKTGEAVAAGRDIVALARKLVTIHTEVDLGFGLEDLRPTTPDWTALAARIKHYGFRRILTLIEEGAAAAGAEVVQATPKVDRSRYRTVRTPGELAELAAALRAAGRFAFDTETTSLDAAGARLVGMSFCWSPTDAAYVPVGHEGVDQNCPDALAVLGPILADPTIKKTGQNLKYDMQVLWSNGCTFAGLDGDTMLLDYLVNVDQKHGLDELARRYLDHKNIAYGEVTASTGGDFAKVPVEQATQYAAEDAHVVWLIENRIAELGALDDDLRQLYAEVELPLVPVLADMERIGIRCSKPALQALSVELAARIDTMTQAIHAEAGEVFNLNSPKQLATILFEKRGLESTKKTKTGASTAADVLEALADQGDALCSMILQYRELAKLKGTYVDALQDCIDTHGRIHTSFHQAVAATGRLSSNEPNLQNIPIRTEEGRRVRACFVPDDGFVFLSADYSQIELRVLAHFCGEGALVDAFLKQEDIHRRTAAEVFGCAPALVSAEQRRAAKAINFGLVYGMSAFRLANELKISRRVAQEYIDGYFARYPQVKTYMDEAIAKAKSTGHARTLFGRRRGVQGLDARNPNDRGEAERVAINTPVQGTAADLIKMAMIRVHRALKADHPRARLLLQVHDELVLEVPVDEVDVVAARVKAEMEGVATLKVPLVVDTGVGASWDLAH
jgi:DNA polymerase-1